MSLNELVQPADVMEQTLQSSIQGLHNEKMVNGEKSHTPAGNVCFCKLLFALGKEGLEMHEYKKS